METKIILKLEYNILYKKIHNFCLIINIQIFRKTKKNLYFNLYVLIIQIKNQINIFNVWYNYKEKDNLRFLLMANSSMTAVGSCINCPLSSLSIDKIAEL